jgi:transposase InsO family protein
VGRNAEFFKLLYGLVILRHARRRLVAISVTTNPTAEWIVAQVTDAFPWDEAPRHLIRDRDGAFSPAYTRRIRTMGIRDHPTAPRSPWQNGHVERLIGSIRRESLDHRWCSTKRSCVAFLRITLLITTRSERISHWTKRLRVFGERRSSAASQRYQSSAGSIINTSRI